MTCLPCEKEIIDNGMGIAAASLYGSVMSGTSVHVAATAFYTDVVEDILKPIGQRLLRGEHGKLSKEQHASLMAQIDKQCYRADEMIAWAKVGNGQHVSGWTDKLFAWVKDDQTFYTALIAELTANSK
jgi:hypothetical protein